MTNTKRDEKTITGNIQNQAEKWSRIPRPFFGHENAAKKMSTHCWCSSFWSHFRGRKMGPGSGTTKCGNLYKQNQEALTDLLFANSGMPG